MLRRDGSKFGVKLESILGHPQEKSDTVNVIVSDITERKYADDALKASEERFRTTSG